MDEATLALLMYLDEGLVTNLSSLLLSGYINIRTTKLIEDRTLTGNAAMDERRHHFDDDRCNEDERDGFKSKSLSNLNHDEFTNTNKGFLENRQFLRREEEYQRIYTTFSLHSQILTQLSTENSIKDFDDITIKDGDVAAGDYVKIKGQLTSQSVNSYLDSVLNIFDCFGCDSLNGILPQTQTANNLINFTSVRNFMNHLNDILNKNNTQDLILNCGETPVVLNVNNNFFMNNHAYVYDRIDCPCTVFGKVIKVAPNGQCVSLLRKTAQQDYYEKLLNNCCPYCDMLTKSGITIPEMPNLRCEGISLVVVPISICM